MKPNIFRSFKYSFLMVFGAIFKNIWVDKKFTVREKIIVFTIFIIFWWVLIPYYAVEDFMRDEKRQRTKVE